MASKTPSFPSPTPSESPGPLTELLLVPEPDERGDLAVGTNVREEVDDRFLCASCSLKILAGEENDAFRSATIPFVEDGVGGADAPAGRASSERPCDFAIDSYLVRDDATNPVELGKSLALNADEDGRRPVGVVVVNTPSQWSFGASLSANALDTRAPDGVSKRLIDAPTSTLLFRRRRSERSLSTADEDDVFVLASDRVSKKESSFPKPARRLNFSFSLSRPFSPPALPGRFSNRSDSPRTLFFLCTTPSLRLTRRPPFSRAMENSFVLSDGWSTDTIPRRYVFSWSMVNSRVGATPILS